MTAFAASWPPSWIPLGAALGHRVRRALFSGLGPRGGPQRYEWPSPPCATHATAYSADYSSEPGDPGHEHPRRGWFPGPAFGPGFGAGFGLPPFGGPGFGELRRRLLRGHRGRRSRGDIRLAVLALLAERPRHGYEIIQEVTERTGGAWRPSPGSVYPTLQQLADEGLVRTDQSEGRRTVSLTDAGTRYVEEHREELDQVWQVAGEEMNDSAAELLSQYEQLHAAISQVLVAGSDEQRAAASTKVAETRKAIYRLLAED